jgi:hypothetical protein
MPVYILMINVKPDNDNPQVEQIAGAYVNCFVEAETFDLAEEIALKFLKEESWLPITLEERWEVTEEDYENDPAGLEVYKQVLIDKEVYTFHTYETEDD